MRNLMSDPVLQTGGQRTAERLALAAELPVHEAALPGEWITGGMAVLDETGKMLSVNEPMRHWLAAGSAKANPTENLWTTLANIQPNWKESIEQALAQAGPFVSLNCAVRHGASTTWFRLDMARHATTQFVQLNSVLPPLAELEEAGQAPPNEAALRQIWTRLLRAEGQWQNLVRRWPGVIFSQRVDLSFHFVSPRIEELTGVPVVEWKQLPQRFWEVVHEGDANELQQQLRQAQMGDGVTSVYRIRHLKTGRVSYILETREAVRTRGGFLLGYEGVWLDVTRQTIAEKRLSTAAWKETLSVVTMGLAHDFSNIMAGIHSLSETFHEQVAPEHPFHEGLALIKRNSLQASQLIHRILNLHRGKIGECAYHNLNDLVSEILELIRKIVPRHVQIETELAPDSLPIYADGVEFRQVLINLALNAIDAMPQGGRLRFKVSRHEQHPRPMHVEGKLPRLPSVCIATEDNGCGIPEALLKNIFDPFFTTKSPEKGSGLGLYNARLFAEKHHGAISVDSVEDRGTTVSVWLPEANFSESEREEAFLPATRRTLLVFGVPGAARDKSAEFLRENGFSVVVGSPGDEVRKLLQAKDYVLTGVLVLANSGDPSYTALARTVRQLGLPLKIIIHPTGCNQDELDSELLAVADLVLPFDLSRAQVLNHIQSLWPGL
jgi:signal transduction histidine kinase